MGNFWSALAGGADLAQGRGSTTLTYAQRANFSAASNNNISGHGDAVTIVSFNLLAPPYKRLSRRNSLGRRLREKDDPELWNERARKAMAFFEQEIFGCASIIALQEFWLEKEYFDLFEPLFNEHGYDLKHLKRMGASKTDSVVLCVKRDEFEIMESKDVQLIPHGDRVALLLHLKQRSSGKRIILANTHLSFPHTGLDSMMQLKQVKALTHAMTDFNDSISAEERSSVGKGDRDDGPVHRFIIGDFNQPLDSPVCDHLRSEGYISTFEISPPTINPDAKNSVDVRDNSDSKPSRHDRDAARSKSNSSGEGEGEGDGEDDTSWVSHRTHREEDVGVDHIFFYNHKHLKKGSGQGSEEGGGGTGGWTGKEKRGGEARAKGSPPRQGWDSASLFIGDCRVLPEDMTCASWDGSFDISDHRPISSEIFLGSAVRDE